MQSSCCGFLHRARGVQRTHSRGLASEVFDRAIKRHHRQRAALSPDIGSYTYLRDEVAERLLERLEDIHESYVFDHAVDLGCGTGHVRRALDGRGAKKLTECDSSPAMLAVSAADHAANPSDFEVAQLHLDEEMPGLEPHSAELITSSMNLHWVNELPGTLLAHT